MPNSQNFQFTKEGFANLKKEHDSLVLRRPQVVINLSNAREQGDLSENAGYHAAKDELSQIDSRIRELKYLLRVGKIVDKTQNEIVSFGSRVIVEIDGKKMHLQIVEELEANPSVGKISTSSLIGSALINRRVGEEISVEVPNGKAVYKILEIS